MLDVCSLPDPVLIEMEAIQNQQAERGGEIDEPLLSPATTNGGRLTNG